MNTAKKKKPSPGLYLVVKNIPAKFFYLRWHSGQEISKKNWFFPNSVLLLLTVVKSIYFNVLILFFPTPVCESVKMRPSLAVFFCFHGNKTKIP